MQIPDTDFYYVTTLEEYEDSISELHKKPELALDTETYVLPKYRHFKKASATDPHTGRISLVVLKGRTTPVFIFDIIKLEQQEYDRSCMYDLLLTRDRLIGQNLQFDLKFLKRHYGVIFENGYDVRLLAKLITNATGSKFGKACGHSLKDLCRDWLNIHISGKGKEQVTDWYPRPIGDDFANQGWQQWISKLKYAANDVRYLFVLQDRMIEVLTLPLPYSEIIRDGTTEPPYGLGMCRESLELQMYMTAVAAEMEYNGLPASREMFSQLKTSIWDTQEDSGKLLEVAAELCHIFSLETTSSLWSDQEIPTDRSFKSLNNPITLKNLIAKQTGINLTTSQTEVLNRMIDLYEQQTLGELEFVDTDEEEVYREIGLLTDSVASSSSHLCKLVNEYKQLRKQFSMDLGCHINPVTGFIHSHIDMLGAATSRSSSSGPNLQQVSGRTSLLVERPSDNLFVSSANMESLTPDWEPANAI